MEQWLPYIPPALTLRDRGVLATQCMFAFRVIPRVNGDYFRKENQGGLCNRHAVFCEAGTGFVYII